MQRINWILTAAVIVGVFGSTAGLHAGCGCNCAMTYQERALCGEACCSPSECYHLTPGCCEDSHPGFDNAWDGYCEHRAKVQAFWAKVGTPKPRRCRPAFYRYLPWLAPEVEQSTCTVQPTPAVPATPPISHQPESKVKTGGLGKMLRLF